MSNKHRLTGLGYGDGNCKSVTIFLDFEDHAGNEIHLTSVEPDRTNPTDDPRKELEIDLGSTHKVTLMGLRDAILEELDSRTR
jgi:hypothetical protein